MKIKVMTNQLNSSNREDLMSKILQLNNKTKRLKSELLRYKLLTNYCEKYVYFLQQIIDQNVIKNELKENEFKQQLLILNCIKLCEIKVNKLDENCINDEHNQRNEMNESIFVPNIDTFGENREKWSQLQINQTEVFNDREVYIEENDDFKSYNEYEDSYSPNTRDCDHTNNDNNKKDNQINANFHKQVIHSIEDNLDKKCENIETIVNENNDKSFGNNIEISNELIPNERLSKRQVENQIECEIESNLNEDNESTAVFDEYINSDETEVDSNSGVEFIEKKKSNSLLKKFQCNHSGCGATYRCRSSLTSHQLIHGKANYKCDFIGCSFKTLKKVDLSEHINKHSGEKRFKCHRNGCNVEYTFRSNLRRHKLEKHSHFNLNNHQKLNHYKQETSCNRNGCHFSTKLKNKMRNHKRSAHTTNPKPYEYELCDSKFRENNLLQHHMYKHEGLRPYVCTQESCGKSFKTLNNLRTHINTHKPIDKSIQFKCDFNECNKWFANSDYLRKHKSTHIKKYVCVWDNCGKSFCSKYTLSGHVNTHTGEKPYICEWPACEQRFAQISNLSSHRKIHKSEKKFNCVYPECKYKTYTNFNLEKHIAVHTGEKKFVCEWPDCDFKAANQSNLKAHKHKCHQ